MAVLPDGRVLMTGGSATPESPAWASTELYDPGTGTWTAAGDLIAGREATSFTTLADGKVFVVGGYDLSGLLSSTELFDPTTGTWRLGGSMGAARFGHTTTLLSDARVLVVGGLSGDDVTSSAELYDQGSGN